MPEVAAAVSLVSVGGAAAAGAAAVAAIVSVRRRGGEGKRRDVMDEWGSDPLDVEDLLKRERRRRFEGAGREGVRSAENG